MARSRSSAKNRKRSVLNSISDFFAHSRYPAYLVGGCPRDVVLGIDPVDIDIVIEGDSIKAALAVNRILKGKLQRHDEFNTATIITKTGKRIDFAGARAEKYASPAVLPSVIPSTIKEDLRRRDFTMNALCISLNRSNLGEIYDPFSGISDIRSGLIRILHENSFIDDPTRIFRALRYKNRLGFRIERSSELKLREAIARGMIKRLTGRRVLNELQLVFEEKNTGAIIKDLVRYRICEIPAAKLAAIEKMGPMKFHALIALSDFKNLPLPGRDARLVREIERLYRVISNLLSARNNHQVYGALSGLSPEVIDVIPALNRKLRGKIAFFRKARNVRPLITGHDLIRAGLKPGPRFSRLLKRAFERQLDEKTSPRNKQVLLKALLEHGK